MVMAINIAVRKTLKTNQISKSNDIFPVIETVLEIQARTRKTSVSTFPIEDVKIFLNFSK